MNAKRKSSLTVHLVGCGEGGRPEGRGEPPSRHQASKSMSKTRGNEFARDRAEGCDR
jgi:hypothetical protein